MNKHGRNWCAPVRRLAIYLRDGLACVYCGRSIERGAILTLDHLIPRKPPKPKRIGHPPEPASIDNASTNLVTCCHRCNQLKKNQDWEMFCAQIADNTDQEWLDVVRHVRHCISRDLPTAQAKTILHNRKWKDALEKAQASE